MPIDLYYMPASAPCRAVLLTAHILDIELNLKLTELPKGQHLTTEFITKNPRHCIPTIDDDGFILSESHAILGYLVDQYGKDDSLYPKDPKKRAIVNQRLYFDCGTLYQRFHNLYNFRLSLMTAQENPTVQCKLEEAFYILNKYLEKQTWIAGEDMTIADISLITTVSSAEILGFELIKYKNVQRWLENGKTTIPGYEEINHSGCLEYRRLYDIAVVRANNALVS